MSTPAKPQLIEIFRAGKHVSADGRSVEFTAADLQTIAAGYDPSLAPAPVVVGHPKLDAPAYGWVNRLVADGDALFAEEGQLDPAFNDMRKAGRFKNRSASFYLPDSPSNPKPGQLYIKHVGWLGATAPAVKGLKPISFSEDEQGVVEFAVSDRRWGFATAASIFRRWRDYLIDTAGLEKADEIVPDWQIQSLQEASTPDGDVSFSQTEEEIAVNRTADFAERERKLQEREQRIAQQEQQQAQAAHQARRDEVVAFADGLVSAGKLLPAQKATVVELVLALPTEAPLSFADGEDTINKPAPELLRELLASLPQQVDFSEKAGREQDNTDSLEFSVPAGASISADRAELYSKAKAYQAQNPNVSWQGAVSAVGG